jgi:phage terminase large subunit GpA-like protein
MSVVYGFTPHQGQQRVIDIVTKTNAKYITVVSPRQIGKSLLLINLILYYAINKKNDPTIGIISPVYSQVRKLIDDLHNAIVDSGIVESSNFSDHEIKLKT